MKDKTLNTVSPLRYPGGKTRAIEKILPLIPQDFSEFREPFVGGGSVFLATKQRKRKNANYIINDLNFDLYCFWKYAKESNQTLYEEVKRIKEMESDGRSLFSYYRERKSYTDFERAVRYFVMNRSSFSGTVDSGGYSEIAFRDRFTYSSIERIKPLESILKDVVIENKSYEDIIFEDGEKVFIFLDPPYYRQASSRLYGKNGDLHTSFNHEKFAFDMKECKHNWIITLDDTEKIKELFNFAYIYQWELQYGMNNYKQGSADKGKELFISNFKLPGMETNHLFHF